MKKTTRDILIEFWERIEGYNKETGKLPIFPIREINDAEKQLKNEYKN